MLFFVASSPQVLKRYLPQVEAFTRSLRFANLNG